ncbi:MAG: elongation factor P hydroxylase [Exilibacterium sp.]
MKQAADFATNWGKLVGQEYGLRDNIKLVTTLPNQDTNGLHCDNLITVFNRQFWLSHNTRLQKGGVEPVYLPADARVSCHRIIFTRDYFSSALHEIAHWCVAGAKRRLQIDYGYWYAADGRSAEQQRLFEQVEVKPQALEWIFSQAAGHGFRASADNLEAGIGPSAAFKRSVHQQVLDYCSVGLPARAAAFTGALAVHYGRPSPLAAQYYQLASL